MNVARDFQTVQTPEAEGNVSLSLPTGFAAADYHVVVYVQSKDVGEIRAAARPRYILNNR